MVACCLFIGCSFRVLFVTVGVCIARSGLLVESYSNASVQSTRAGSLRSHEDGGNIRTCAAVTQLKANAREVLQSLLPERVNGMEACSTLDVGIDLSQTVNRYMLNDESNLPKIKVPGFQNRFYSAT